MRTRINLAGVTVALLIAGCQAPAPAALTDQDVATLRGMFDSTAQWIKAGDWATWVGQYSDDAVLQPPNAPTVTGRAALLAWGEAFPPVEDLVFSNVAVSGEGNLAYGSCDYVLTLQGSPPDAGKQLVVFRRAAGGPWQVVAASFNSDAPAAPMAPPAK